MGRRGEDALVIDRAAAAAPPGEREIAEWGAVQRVFVSSVMDGYGDFRAAAIRAIEAVGATPVAFERFGGRDADSEAAYLSEVASSTIYAGLIGARYGARLPSRYAATHAEYLEAERSGLRLSVWVQQGVEREGPQQSFFEDVRAFNVYGSYSTPEDLERGLAARLRSIAAEDLSPWCKLGPLVFRAREITVGGGRSRVAATVHDDAVADALHELGTGWGRSDALLTYQDRCFHATVEGVTETTRAARSRDFSLELAVKEPSQPMQYSLNGMDWDEGTELALRVSLFGEPNPLGLMSSQAEVTNPFPALVAAGVAEEALRPIARLLLTETLVTERGIRRITHFQLGPNVGGRRAMRLGWIHAVQGRPPAAPREVEGQVEV